MLRPQRKELYSAERAQVQAHRARAIAVSASVAASTDCRLGCRLHLGRRLGRCLCLGRASD